MQCGSDDSLGRQLRRPQADELSDLVCLLVLVSGVTLLQQAGDSFIIVVLFKVVSELFRFLQL